MNIKFIFCLAAAGAAGCGTSPDSRPKTFEYITLEVLSPACAMVACHSTSTKVEGYAFDTLAASRASLRQLVRPGDPEHSELYTIIATPEEVMPPDAPLATEDIDLIRSWILDGAPGL
ncbi:MAG TPA: c-type cytochrome domain-containing protein [Kofleriaceae bacterium]|nr:c-type cytochrome domain-containing protein [Kofleriaceae bacterium]